MNEKPLPLDRVFEDATDPILIEDLHGVVIAVNGQAERTYGWARAELIGRSIKTIVPPEKHGQADELLAACLAGEEVRDVEGLRQTKTGEVQPVLITLSLLRDDAGQARAVATFCKDISALRLAQLRHQQLARLFLHAVDPVILEDTEGRVLELNAAARRLYGFSAGELKGRPIKAIVPAERHQQADELLRRCLAGEEVRDVRALRRTKLGEVLPVLLTLSLVPDADGKPAFVASFSKSVQELVSTQEALQKLNAELEGRVEARTLELAATNERLAHELEVARELSRAAAQPHEMALLGSSAAVGELRASLTSHAAHARALLISGPSGAGHEAVARAVHEAGARAGGPFIYVDCARFAKAADTLFGVRTDHDGTISQGKAHLARGGTLFLAHVDALPAAEQAAVADAISAPHDNQSGALDMRVTASLAGDYAQALSEHRLDPLLARALAERLVVPSLHERKNDVAELARAFVQARVHSLGKPGAALTETSLARLGQYSWPGNIRELESVLERAVMLSKGDAIEVPEELLSYGTVIGGYRLDRRLGVGGMGEVWLAQHALLARPAAVKLIRQEAIDATSGDELLQRFEQEAQVTAQLRSPHTIELYDFGVSDEGNFYYVMEYLDGIDLDVLVQSFGALTMGRCIHLLKQACLSLHEAHEAGLVHRDIKPANLFVCNLGLEQDFLKVLDFGVVRQIRPAANAPVTAAGDLTGTPETMAPEVLLGEPADRRADIYALGCVAYYLLSREVPFNGPTLSALLLKHLTAEPQPLTKLHYQLDPAVDKLVMQCMSKDPAARPATALELRQRLSELQQAHPWHEADAAQWWLQHIAPLRQDSPDPTMSLSKLAQKVPSPKAAH